MLSYPPETKDIRMRHILATLALLGLTAPAHAGMRATYSDGTQGKPLVVEVGDNGDARISGGEEGEYGLMIGGHFYVVGTGNGAVKVARIEDIAAAIDRVMPPVFKGMFAGAPSSPTRAFRIEKKGARNVAGHEGVVYAVHGLNAAKPDEAQEYVMSTDPALKPVGAAMEQFMNAAIIPATPLIGPGAAELVANTHAIFALGTPLDVGRFKLAGIAQADIPAATLTLPARPETVDQLVSEMKAAQTVGQ